jgi:Fe-S-cluster containining protein
MKFIKRFLIMFVLLDNFLTNLPKKLFFKTRWVLDGKCKQCGRCCQQILMKASPRQLSSPFFMKLAIGWTCWLFDFIFLHTDHENGYIAFTCKNLKKSGSCGNYFWRPNVCRNFPLVDYFEEPKILPWCGFRARRRDIITPKNEKA